MECDRHLFLIGLGLGLNLQLDNGFRELHLLENDGFVGIAERLARADIFEALESHDIAGVGFLDFLAILGVHEVHAPCTLLLVARAVQERHALLELAGIDTAEGDRTDVLEAHDLEGDHGERLVIGRLACGFATGLGIDALVGLAIDRARQEVHHGVKQRLHAFVFEGRAAHHRIEGAGDRGFTNELA